MRKPESILAYPIDRILAAFAGDTLSDDPSKPNLLIMLTMDSRLTAPSVSRVFVLVDARKSNEIIQKSGWIAERSQLSDRRVYRQGQQGDPVPARPVGRSGLQEYEAPAAEEGRGQIG